MQINFIGQRGIPTLDSSPSSATEQRVQALAAGLAADGHTIAVSCTAPYISRRLRNYQNVTLCHYPSLNSTRPGGLLYNLTSIIAACRRQPDVLHIHGYAAASFLWLAALISPHTTFIWTIDHLPSRLRRLMRLVMLEARTICDSITTPTRALQYQLRTDYGLSTTYIPDGYSSTLSPDIPLHYFGLRKSQYCLALLPSLTELRWLIRHYPQTRSRKPLVAVIEPSPATTRLASRYPWLKIISPRGRRPATTLARHAAAVIAFPLAPLALLLAAMDTSRAIVATATPLNEETLGVTAQFFRPRDAATFRAALAAVIKSRRAQLVWGRRAEKRARAHFTLSRIMPEYLALYHTLAARPVQLDSAVSTLATSSYTN